MRTKSVLLATVLSLLAVGIILLLAACNGGGGGEESTGDQTSPTEQETQAPAEQETQAPAETEEPEEEVAGGDIDPCALVTKEEVEAAVGASVLEPQREDFANLFTCSYNDPDTPIVRTVSVNVIVAEREDQARDSYEMFKDLAPDAEAVAGIGDEAFWDSVVKGLDVRLEVLKGKYDISIKIDLSPDGGDALAIAKELAAKLLGRLP